MLRRSLLQIMATAALALACNSAAFAHSAMASSSPANGETVSSPSMLMLTFGDDVRLVKVDLVGAAGSVDAGFVPKAEAGKMFHVPVPALAAGAYTVNWSILGADGHAVSESFRFNVDPAAPAAVMNHGEAMSHDSQHMDHAAHGDMPMDHSNMPMDHGKDNMPMDHGAAHQH